MQGELDDKNSEVDEVLAQVRKDRRIRIQAAALTAATSVGGIVVLFTSYSFDSKSRFDVSSMLDYVRNEVSSNEKVEAEAVRRQAQDVFDEILRGVNSSPSSSIDVALLAEHVSSVDGRLKTIERSISENPERALSIPLLRRDLNELSKKLDEFKVSSKVESDRLWAQQNTILQGIGALLLAVAGGAVTIGYRLLRSSAADKKGLLSSD